MEQRKISLLASVPEFLIFEEGFKNSGHHIEAKKLNLDFSGMDESNMMKCSPILSREQEFLLFRKYNYFRYRIVSTIAGRKWESAMKDPVKMGQLISRMNNKQVLVAERFVRCSEEMRNIILKSNMRLMMRPISRYENQDSTRRDDLISNSCMHIIKAINRFDYKRGIKFSTYCVNAIKNNLCRDYSTESSKRSRFWYEMENFDLVEGRETSSREYDHEFITGSLESLGERERFVIKSFFGIEAERMTMKSMAEKLGLSRPAISNIKDSAMIRLAENKYDPSIA